MSMRKKDFEAIAAAIKDERDCMALARPTLDRLARVLANHCAEQNPRFNRVRFLQACGVGE